MHKDEVDVEPIYEEEFCVFCNETREHTVVNKVINGVLHRKGHCLSCNRKRNLPHNINPQDFVMCYGMHKGKKLSEIDSGYLSWLLETNLNHAASERVKSVLRSRGEHEESTRVSGFLNAFDKQ